MKTITVGYGKVKKIKIGGNLPLVFIGGPCAIESKDHAFYMVEKIQKICSKVGIKSLGNDSLITVDTTSSKF